MTIENASKITKVDSIRVGLAPPELIKNWAERTLPNGKIVGQVTSSQTVNYKTLKPEKDGLFCERIFGPVKDFECSCGRKKNKTQQQFCPDCNVEFTSARVRRYRLGYIQLVSPVTHVWYLKGNPSYLSILLDIKKRHLEYITYCSETLTLENALKGGAASSKSSDIVSSWNKLKQQIMDKEQEKTTNLNDKKTIQPNINLLHNKIEKREKLKLKKYKYWKQFYNENTPSSECLLLANTDPFFSKEKKGMNNGFISTKDIGESATHC